MTNAWSTGLKFKQNRFYCYTFSVSLTHADIVISNIAWNVRWYTVREFDTRPHWDPFSVFLEAIIVPTSCKATSGSRVPSARWCLVSLEHAELCIPRVEQLLLWEKRKGRVLPAGRPGGACCWGDRAVLLIGVGKPLMSRKPSWFLLSLEFRKRWELEGLVALENQILASGENAVSLCWRHFDELRVVFLCFQLPFWVLWMSFLSWASWNNFCFKSFKEMDASFTVCL